VGDEGGERKEIHVGIRREDEAVRHGLEADKSADGHGGKRSFVAGFRQQLHARRKEEAPYRGDVATIKFPPP